MGNPSLADELEDGAEELGHSLIDIEAQHL